MKKNVLLYTVSSVLFYSSTSLSYALHSTPPSPMGGLSSSQPTHVKCQVNTTGVFDPYNDLCDGTGQPIPPQPSSPPSTYSAPTLPTTSGLTTITTPPIVVESTTSNPAGSVSSQAQSEGNLRSGTDSTRGTARSSTPTQPSKQPTTPKISTDSSEAKIITKPEASSKNEGTQPSTTKATQAPTAETASTTDVAKSRRRSGVPSFPTDSSSEETAPNSTVTSQPEVTRPSPNLQSTPKIPGPTKPVTEVSTKSVQSTPTQTETAQKVPTNSNPTGPESQKPATEVSSSPKESKPTRPTAEQSPAPKEPELSSMSLRPAAGKSISQGASESVKPAPAHSVSAQKTSEKSELSQPISPVKQPENPSRIEDISAGVEAKNGNTITLHNKKIQDRWNAVSAEGNNSKIKMNGGSIDAGFIALSVSEGGEIDATDITVTAETAGLVNIEGTINLKDSNIQITGEFEANGIIFRNNPYHVSQRRHPRNAGINANAIQKQNIVGKVNLENTKFFVENGVGISLYGTNTNGVISLKNSEIHADALLKNIKNENESTNTLTLVAEHSFLEGRVRTSENNRTIFDLKKETKWLLKPNKNTINNDRLSENDIISYDYRQFGLDEKSFSNLSVLRLTDSAIMFNKPEEGHYQTLFIGPQRPKEDGTAHTAAVYSATGVAEIYVNTQWNKHSPVTEQQTDRIVINGDVSGNTIVHINLQETDKTITDGSVIWGEQMASLPLGTHGVSIIQVSGQANENSFTLAGNYMTIGGQPYKYILASYKPGTSHESQSLFGKKSDFWDFRLQNAYIDKDKKVRALLPQVANYLTLPNTLFSSGFADVNNQNRLLDAMRTTAFSAADHKKHNLFFSSYGEKVTLSSNRGPLRYGYDADVNYKALQLGAILATSESKDISAHFGLLGTYGKLAFTPKEMQDSEKTTLDKWSITAYSSLQHSNGLYINTLLSYGKLKGNITTALVGNAAKLDGTEILNLSATLGQKLTTGIKGLVFEPQAQLIYQNLMFDIFSDANGLKVDMGNPRQWLIRFGGRLTKTITTVEENKAVSFYGKMNVIRTFGDGKTIKIADTFDLDPTGSSIEGGIGVNAYLSQNIVLNGDISYRQKLQKTGVSGTNVSGGIRYHF
ncbi:autotransporter outer membrane beta-barrel domain-containing protein [Bartonella krasnovii]|uniref:autotransporter outer membrane beta-barrel domain-containing protein n=1 Tax=Bartonella krasnovii TaxID=2267275 RepID=UPI001F4CF84D|nr:autotransporter outer membrane beta-barrel domain-containing protein [Bartonella krasnovii]UNF35088.1 autotransporter outer membrane beta-barrel domain-containing protein [Bartonella krasnovii]UNF48262.1 autotransporter outer membrane beta-barrel domain-containing protein [Bartonella krasnovii]